MKINSINAKNFKAFKELDLKLNGKSTVIFGVNGTGKTTVLAILNYLCWNWLSRLNPAQGTAFKSLNAELVSFGSSQMEISSEIQLSEQIFELKKAYFKARPGKKALVAPNKKLYDSFVEYFMELYGPDGKNVPVFVNYGTNRSVLDIPLRIRKKHDFSKWTALERTIENELDYRTFFEWFRNQEDYESEIIREKQDFSYKDIYIQCVRTAVEAMLDDFCELKVKRNPLRMTVKKNGVEYSVDQLSDGEKCTLALFGDLARRLALANPALVNPLEGEGVVLIDEIELHMHPRWQRRILPVLHKTFPNIQFIVTTHSPQVLGEVNDEYNLYRLSSDGSSQIEPCESTFGWDSSSILRSKMNTSERNDDTLLKFKLFYDALDEERYAEAEAVLESLEAEISDDSEVVAMRIQFDLEQL